MKLSLPMKLSDLQARGIGRLVGDDVVFSGVSTDTRSIVAGDLFIALRGEHYDAHDFLPTAVEKKAVAVVVEEECALSVPRLVVEDTVLALGAIAEFYRESFLGEVIAITGSCGKTTVKGMLHSILSLEGDCIATQGNYNNHIGVPLTLFRLSLQAKYAIIEAGTSGPGEIAYLTQLIKPDVSLVTNVMPAHLEGLGSVSRIAEEKSHIHSYAGTRLSVVNFDDAAANTMLEKLAGRALLGFSQDAKNPLLKHLKAADKFLIAEDIHSDALGRASFDLVSNDGALPASLSVLGKHNVANALAAAACALAVGVAPSIVVNGLAGYGGEKGRMQVKKGRGGFTVIDDTYNANPGSMKAAIDFLSSQVEGVLVSGSMGELGEDSEKYHKEIGQYAKTKGLKHLFTVGGDAGYIASAFGEGAFHFANKESLVEALNLLQEKVAVVLVKGSRSTKMETVVAALVSSEEQ